MKRRKNNRHIIFKRFSFKIYKASLKHSHNFSHKPKIHIFGKEGRFRGSSKSHSLVETFAHYCAVFLNLSFVSLHIRWRLKILKKNFFYVTPLTFYQTCVEISQFVSFDIKCYELMSLYIKMWNWCLPKIENWFFKQE